MRTPTVLFTTPLLHHPPYGGPELRIENSIKALHTISDLHIYCRAKPVDMGGEEAVRFYERHCKTFRFARYRKRRNPLSRFLRRAANSIAKRIVGRKPFAIGTREEDLRELIRHADRVGADVIWLGYGNISYPLLRYLKENSDYKVVVDTDSVWSRFVERGLPYASTPELRARIERETREKQEEERWGTALADVTTAVSEVDAEYYRGLARTPDQVHVFSNVIDVGSYTERPAPPPDFKTPCAYLAGTFGPDSPMEDAARLVIDEVWPIVRERRPGMHFYVVGRESHRVLSDVDAPDITVTGPLPSVLPYLANADVSVVSLRFESGTRFKILEAGACGVPVVSTTLGAEGIPVTHGEDILIADTPEELASAILEVVSEPERAASLGANLKALVSARYSVASLAEEGRRILDRLA